MRIYPVLVLLLATVFFYHPVFVGGKLVSNEKALNNTYPWRHYREADQPWQNYMSDTVYAAIPWIENSARQYREFKIPQWSTGIGGGYFFGADTARPTYYPPSALFYSFFPPNSFYGLIAIIHLFIGGISVYYLASDYNCPGWGSLLGGIVMIAGSRSVTALGIESMEIITGLLPLALLMVDRFFTRNNQFVYLLYTGLVCGMAGLANFGQLWFGFMVLVGVWFLFRLFGNTHTDKAGVKVGKQIRHTSLFSVAMLLGILLCSVQLLPLMHELGSAARDFGTKSTAGYIPWYSFITFLGASIFGTPASNSFIGGPSYSTITHYIGIIPLFFLLLGVFRGIKERFRGLGGSTVLIILLFLFTATVPLTWKLLIQLPIFGKMYHFQYYLWLLPGLLGLSVADGSRLESLPSFKSSKLISLSAFAFILSAILITLWLLKIYAAEITILRLQLLYNLFNAIIVVVGIVIFVWSLRFLLIKINWHYCLPFFLILITLIDLKISLGGYPTYSKRGSVLTKTEGIRFLEKLPPGRIIALDINRFPSALEQDIPVFFGLMNTKGVPLIYPDRYRKYLRAAEYGVNNSEKDDLLSTKSTLRLRNHKSKLYNVLGVRYFIANPDTHLSADNLRLLYNGDISIYENLDAVPRAYFTSQYTVQTTYQDQLRYLSSSRFSLSKDVVLEQPLDMPSGDGAISSGIVDTLDWSDGDITLEADIRGYGVIVLCENYHSGWRVLIDGHPDRVVRVNGVQIGIPVGPGHHRIHLKFQAQIFKLGLSLSLISLAGILCCLTILFFAHRRKSADSKTKATAKRG